MSVAKIGNDIFIYSNRGEHKNLWPEQQIDRCIKSFKTMNGIKMDTGNVTPQVTNEAILKNIRKLI